MVIDKKILDELTAKAKENPRLRCNLDMRNCADDQSQRMLTLSTSVTTRHSSSMLGSALAAPSVHIARAATCGAACVDDEGCIAARHLEGARVNAIVLSEGDGVAIQRGGRRCTLSRSGWLIMRRL